MLYQDTSPAEVFHVMMQVVSNMACALEWQLQPRTHVKQHQPPTGHPALHPYPHTPQVHLSGHLKVVPAGSANQHLPQQSCTYPRQQLPGQLGSQLHQHQRQAVQGMRWTAQHQSGHVPQLLLVTSSGLQPYSPAQLPQQLHQDLASRPAAQHLAGGDTEQKLSQQLPQQMMHQMTSGPVFPQQLSIGKLQQHFPHDLATSQSGTSRQQQCQVAQLSSASQAHIHTARSFTPLLQASQPNGLMSTAQQVMQRLATHQAGPV